MCTLNNNQGAQLKRHQGEFKEYVARTSCVGSHFEDVRREGFSILRMQHPSHIETIGVLAGVGNQVELLYI